MASTLICDIVTPDSMLFSGEAVMVSAPAGEGDIGLMHQCSPLMSTLKRGTVRIKDENDKVVVYAVDGGYLETDGQKVVVLASHAIDVATIDKDFANQRIEANKKRMEELADDDSAKAFAEESISWQTYLLTLIK